MGAGGTVDVPVALTATSPHEDFTAPSDAPQNVGINVATAYVRGPGRCARPRVEPARPRCSTPAASAPVAQVASPAPGAVGVPTAASVAARFSEPMTVDATGAALTLRRADTGAIVPGTVAASDGATLFTLTPTAPLAPGTTYTASVSGAAIDADRTPVAAPLEWSFTTAGAAATRRSAAVDADLARRTAVAGVAAAAGRRRRPDARTRGRRRGEAALRARRDPGRGTRGRPRRPHLGPAHHQPPDRPGRPRRAEAIRDWLDAGVRARDLCIGALTAAEFAPGVDLAGGPVVEAAGVARPRPLAPARAAAGSRVPLGAASMRPTSASHSGRSAS